MAFAKGTESTEAQVIKRYIGLAPVYVLAVNPDKATLEKVYNTTLDEEPNYISEAKEADGSTVNTVRVSFLIKTDAEKVGEEVITNATFFLREQYQYNKDKSKVKVIDKYGRTAWATIDEAKNKTIPQYSSGPAKIDADFRPMVVGEEELTNFIKTYLCVPALEVFNSNTQKWGPNPKVTPADCEARLDSIKNYFKGDFTELREAIKLQPNNKVKLMFGVRTADNGAQYQAVYTRVVLSNNSNSTNKLTTDLAERKSYGAFNNTEFDAGEFREYVVKPTEFNTTPTENTTTTDDELPF